MAANSHDWRKGWVPVRCAVCTDCLGDPATGRCWFGGPFAGWRWVLTKEEVESGLPAAE